MARTVRGLALALCAVAVPAAAQPVDPYSPAPPASSPAPAPARSPAPAPAPTPAPAPAPSPAPAPAPAPATPSPAPGTRDPVLAEQVAEQLVARAQELFDAKMFVDAKQLAVEALVESDKGPAAQHAQFLIAQVNQQLGIRETTPPSLTPKPTETKPAKVDATPIQDPTLRVDATPAPEGGEHHDGHIAAAVHAGLAGGLLGAAIGSWFDSNNPAAGAVPMGIVGGAVAALFVPRLLRSWDEAKVRTVGSGTLWGGAIGGLFSEIVLGSNDRSPSGGGILVGASLGAAAGGVGGWLLTRSRPLTRGDVALVDTMAGIGTVGGLTLGMLMQPAQTEAYSLNAMLGAMAGVTVGLIAAPQTNTTPRRMLRVAGLAAAGGVAPFLLYAAINDSSTDSDERLAGALSTLGLVGGAWLGFYLTRNMDVGLDVPDGVTPKSADAPPAVVGRASDGTWQLGGLGLMATPPALTNRTSVSLTLLGGRF